MISLLGIPGTRERVPVCNHGQGGPKAGQPWFKTQLSFVAVGCREFAQLPSLSPRQLWRGTPSQPRHLPYKWPEEAPGGGDEHPHGAAVTCCYRITGSLG